ncbi:MAG: polyhydroxyalkanoate depolymerase [Alphaproteobacteria bacterium]|nr:polyhydroxyalkanoate depolymerase [Alphaproteobacteria bacterium]
MFGHPVANPFNQPEQLPLGITHVTVGSSRLPVRQRRLLDLPFATLNAYSHEQLPSENAVLAIPPLSGHYPILFHDLILALLQQHEVFVCEWKNARYVSLSHGPFDFAGNIDYIIQMISAIGPRLNVIGLCQSAVPTLAAVSAINRSKRPLAARSLILLGGPVDPLANPRRVVGLLRERPLDWFADNVIQVVPRGAAGEGRRIYPAHLHLSGLLAYLTRHVTENCELSEKVTADDGSAAKSHPFLHLFTSLMDLPAEHFLENIDSIYHNQKILTGQLACHGNRIEPQLLKHTALMTVEGADDDIAAPGQTFAAHKLCLGLPDELRHHLMVDDCGHFSLFHGRICREIVVPQINKFIEDVANGC